MDEWIHQVRARDLDGTLHTLLDVLEPLGPLGAQVLWVMQPAAGLIGGRSARAALAQIAEALETPGGIESLRARLDASTDDTGRDLSE